MIKENYCSKNKEVQNRKILRRKSYIKNSGTCQRKVEAHSSWQAQIEKVEALRNEFFATGKVPADVNEETWSAFKNAVRDFNALKNSFYKDIKKTSRKT